MKRSFTKKMESLAAILGIGNMFGSSNVAPIPLSTTGKDPEAPKKMRKPRYERGDRFYMALSYKRVGGKWRVKR